MQPTSEDLLKSIIIAIDQVILPAIEDKQAASALRSARALLDHLQKRINTEADIMLADNGDAQKTFSDLARHHADEPACAALQNVPALGSDVAPSMASLQALNRQLQQVAEAILAALPRAGTETPPQRDIRKSLRAYLTRRLARERDLIFPTFLGPPF